MSAPPLVLAGVEYLRAPEHVPGRTPAAAILRYRPRKKRARSGNERAIEKSYHPRGRETATPSR